MNSKSRFQYQTQQERNLKKKIQVKEQHHELLMRGKQFYYAVIQ